MLQMPFDVVRLVFPGQVLVGQIAVQRWPCCFFGRGVYTTAEQVLRALSDWLALHLCTLVVVIPHLSCMLCMTT